MSSFLQPLLEIQGISKKFQQHQVLTNINLTVHKGETVCILGPSGSGKSTLLRCINHLDLPDHGSVKLSGKALGVHADGKRMRDHELALQRTQIGMVFQQFALWPHLTVLQNITEAPIHVQKRRPAEVIDEAHALLKQVGLADKHNAYPAKLSGGQKQRVGIVRALAIRPLMLMLDEPTSALDPELVQDVLNIMQQLASNHMTMLVVTHEMDFASRVAHRIVFMDQGSIIETGTPRDFFNNPQTKRAQAFLAPRYDSRTTNNASQQKIAYV